MAYSDLNCWMGIGEKTGGMLFVVGMEGTEGMLFNMGNPNTRAGFSLLSGRVGLGLGGSAGLVVMFVFNCNNIYRIHNTQNNDWGFNLSLGGQWSKIGKALRSLGFYGQVARTGAALARLHGPALDTFRNAAHYMYTSYDIASMDSEPKVVCIDTPVGGGVEASLNVSFGRIEIS